MPPSETETGVWSFSPFENAETFPTFNGGVLLPLSFMLPLPTGLAPSAVHVILKNGEELTATLGETPPTQCQGTASAPSAEPGNLCIYAGVGLFTEEEGGETGKVLILTEDAFYNPATGDPGTATTGMALKVHFLETEGAKAIGTWAVTAPAAP